MARRRNSVTIRDVAEDAGVSLQTVSRVINDEPNGLFYIFIPEHDTVFPCFFNNCPVDGVHDPWFSYKNKEKNPVKTQT